MLEAAEAQLELIRAEAVATDDPRLLHSVGLALLAFGDLAGGSRNASEGDRASAAQHYAEAATLYTGLAARTDLPAGEAFEIRYQLPVIRNRQADLLIEQGRLDEAVARIKEARALLEPLASGGDVTARREYNIAFERLGDLEAGRGDTAAALGHYLEHLAEMESVVSEGTPGDPDLARGLAMSLRRVGFARGELGETDAARAALERSLELMTTVSKDRPDDLRRARDVGWALIYLGQFLLASDDPADRDLGADHYVDASRRLVAICIAEPDAAGYRADVGSVVPEVRRQLIAAGYPEHADRQLRAALLALQPVVEGTPENTALEDLQRSLLELGN